MNEPRQYFGRRSAVVLKELKQDGPFGDPGEGALYVYGFSSEAGRRFGVANGSRGENGLEYPDIGTFTTYEEALKSFDAERVKREARGDRFTKSYTAPGLGSEPQAATFKLPAPSLEARKSRPYIGILVDHGAAPYKDDPTQSRSYYATIESKDGKQRKTWGKELQFAIESSGVRIGERIELELMGQKPVTIDVDARSPDGTIGTERKQTHVNQWLAKPAPALQPPQAAPELRSPSLAPLSVSEGVARSAVRDNAEQAPARPVTREAEPILADMEQHRAAQDPVLQRAFAMSENAFELRGRQNLALAERGGMKLDISTAEEVDPRLGRDALDGLESRYFQNSWNRHGGGRLELSDYVEQLKTEAQKHYGLAGEARGDREQAERAKSLGDRYSAQAQFEMAAVAQARSPGTQVGVSQMAEANANLAKADLAGRSHGAASAETRLNHFAPKSRSEWIRDTYKTSDLRSELETGRQQDYDRYREVAGASLAQSKGRDPKTYSMTPAESIAFENKFVAFFDAKDRGVNLYAQRDVLRKQGKEHSLPLPKEASTKEVSINGSRKANAPALQKVPEAVAIAGFGSRRADDGRSVEYTKTGQDLSVAFKDTGARVKIGAGMAADDEVLRGALTLAASKFERLSVKGSQEFRERSAREAVRMGLGDRISNPELNLVLQDEQKKMLAQSKDFGHSVQQASVTQPISRAEPTLAAARQSNLQPSQSVGENVPDELKHQVGSETRDEKLAPSAELPVVSSTAGKIHTRAMGGDQRLPVVQARAQKGTGVEVGGNPNLPVTQPRSQAGGRELGGNPNLPVVQPRSQESGRELGQDVQASISSGLTR